VALTLNIQKENILISTKLNSNTFHDL